MCLSEAKRIFPEKDITCYKVVYYYNDVGKMYSPFHSRKTWKLGQTSTLKQRTLPVIKAGRTIEDGAYHTFEKKCDAIRYSKCMYGGHIRVVKCVIPKSSKYVYRGIAQGYQCLASQKLKPVEILKDERKCFRDEFTTFHTL